MNGPYPYYQLPRITGLRQMIELQAREAPERVAFRYREGKNVVQKTVSEFREDICVLSAWLLSHGFRNAHLALTASNSYLWIVVCFAVICSGSVLVPIDKDLPEDEMIRLIRHSESVLVFADRRRAERLNACLCPDELIDLSAADSLLSDGRTWLAEGNTAFAESRPDPDRPAMIVYTSGTTGQPKGVVLSQKNIVSNINACCKSFNPMGDALSVLPFHHMFGLVPALIMFINYRSTVFICSGLKYFMLDLQIARPRTIMLVPLLIESVWKMFRKMPETDLKSLFGGNLEYILVGGAALDPFYEQAFRSRGISLIPAYGATECSPGIAVNRNHYYREGSAGQPIEGCEVRIADDGEILIRGDNVFSGYYRDAESTGEALAGGWYHSGDLGYLDRDGFLFITGRKKNLLILSNGENVSPEPLEARISTIEGVREVLVYEENNTLSAEIFADDSHRCSADFFRREIDRINETLRPSFRIRNIRLRETEFPKNSTHKILREEALKKRSRESV